MRAEKKKGGGKMLGQMSKDLIIEVTEDGYLEVKDDKGELICRYSPETMGHEKFVEIE